MDSNVIAEIEQKMVDQGSFPEDPKEKNWATRAIELYEKVWEAITTLTDACNSGDVPKVADIITEKLQRTHRTLQQSFINVLFKVIYDYAEQEDRWIDGRNECARELCQHMIAGVIAGGKYMYVKEDGTKHKGSLPLI